MERLLVPLASGNNLELQLNSEKTLYLVGPNGSGKSSLLSQWKTQNQALTLVQGNREVIFPSSQVSISGKQANEFSNYSEIHQRKPKSRSEKGYSNNENWLNLLVFKLKARGDFNNELYVRHDLNGDEEAKALCLENSPLRILNATLAACGLPLRVEWDQNASLLAKKDGIHKHFEFKDMSDGERSVFIIAVAAILAEKNSVLMIDEPERHLHRSISSPLLAHLREIRPDVSWVIATHDITLPRDNNQKQVLLTYAFQDSRWDAELLTDLADMPEPTVQAIYGARHRVLFVEGSYTSLDLPVYQALFEDVTVVPSGPCNEVIRAVKALNRSKDVHLMLASGIIDADNRADLADLKKVGVSALKVYAIESLYYHPIVVEDMLEQAGTEASLKDVLTEACKMIDEELIEKQALDAAYKSMRNEFAKSLPSLEDFEIATEDVSIRVSEFKALANKFATEVKLFVSEGQWQEVLERISIKKTGAPTRIATALGYKNVHAYRMAVLKKLRKDAELRKRIQEVVPRPFG